MIKDIILKNLKKTLEKMGVKDTIIDLDHPSNSSYGDYATGVALKLVKDLKKNPMEIAQVIVDNLAKDEMIEKIEVIKPGFINFWILKVQLINRLNDYAQNKFSFPAYHFGKNKKIIVEFAHPNTHKLFHIGHLRNISTGESLVRIFEAVGNEVIRANYQGDVGLHIAKCLWKVKSEKFKVKSLKTLKEKIDFIGQAYTNGTQAYETDKKAKEEILAINKMIYDQDPEIQDIWKETVGWSLEYFNQIYKRVGSRFDKFYFESECYKRGIQVTNDALKKSILEKSQGAVVFNGKKYGLDTRVFINSLGFPTYEGKELALAEKEFSDFGQIDKCIHVVTPEQTSFFKITFKVEELLDEKKYKDKQYHLAYEWVKLKAGKMSSREGNIIEANWLLDEIKNKIFKQYKCDDKVAEILAVAAAKYSFLKNSTQTIIAFDFDESIALEGNSGAYLLYTYVRCQSVLKKINYDFGHDRDQSRQLKLTKEETTLLRTINQFSEIVEKAAKNLAPNIIANYLFELAQKYNLFYQKNPILKADEKTKNFRLFLTATVANILKQGLYLLGIETVEKM